jgi:XTP/dITP diphosphohydrolase
MHDTMKELGDVMMHLCFYAKIGDEKGEFDIYDVLRQQTDKLIFRHPHIYHQSQVGADHPLPLDVYSPTEETPTTEQDTTSFAQAKTADDVLQNWEQIKLKEKDGNKRVLSGVPAALPSVIKAYRIQEKARNVGFDWEQKEDVWAKVKEELGELEAELRKPLPEHPTDEQKAALRSLQEGELGDFMFALINAARLYKLNPDNALEHANAKFIRRFTYIEEHSIRMGKPLTEMPLQEMDALWNEAKQKEKVD